MSKDGEPVTNPEPYLGAFAHLVALRDGDLVNIDVSAELDGYFADTGASFVVGESSARQRRLLDATREARDAAIAQLRPEYRACILLRHVEDKSYEEIAATLDLPLGTVKTYIHRARNELRGHLTHLRI